MPGWLLFVFSNPNADQPEQWYSASSATVSPPEKEIDLSQSFLPEPPRADCSPIVCQARDGRRFRVLAIVDDFSHECLGQIAYTSLSGIRVTRQLSAIMIG